MLIIAAFISLGVGMGTEGPETGFKDGLAVLIAVMVVVAITAVNDYQKERQFRRLNDVKNDRTVTVLRGEDKRERISIYDLLVGDVVIIDTGDIIPADGVFLSGESMRGDESSATGESRAINKGMGEKLDPFFLSGTQLIEGNGEMLVIAVGELSFHGRIMLSLRTPSQDTPLQEKLGKFADAIGNFGIVAALFIFMAQVIKYFAIEGSGVDGGEAGRNVVDFIVIAISIVVVAVPEGLPLAVTISLAYSMRHMMRDNNLVRCVEWCLACDIIRVT
jgi:Ca2+-transporting ATPase